MSELLDRFVPDGETQSERADGRAQDGAFAFDRFLEVLIPGEPPADEFKRAILYAALGAALVFAAGVILVPLPSKETILGSSFYWLGQITLANAMGAATDLAMPAMLFGLTLLGAAGVVAAAGKHIDHNVVYGFCVTLPVIGVVAVGLSLAVWLLLIAVFAVNLAGYIILGIVALAILGVFLGALAQ